MEDLGSKPSSGHRSSPRQEEKKQRCISVSSNLNNFLISLFHLPFSGQQGDEHRGQRRTSCDAPRTPGTTGLNITGVSVKVDQQHQNPVTRSFDSLLMLLLLRAVFFMCVCACVCVLSGLSTSAKHSKQRSCSGIPESSADIFKTSCELEKVCYQVLVQLQFLPIPVVFCMLLM